MFSWEKLDQRYLKLQDIVQRELSYAAHDLDHVLRVTEMCLVLAQKEQEVDLSVLIPAALLHDIARRYEDEDVTGTVDHALLGAEMAAPILADLGYDRQSIRKIQDCIRRHRFRSGAAPDTIEAKILFDADKLDVIGAVGVARSFIMAGIHGERMFSNVPLEDYLRDNVTENGRIKDVAKHTVNLEYELKLKKIPERLYTAEARKIAAGRICFMQYFFEILEQEIKGER